MNRRADLKGLAGLFGRFTASHWRPLLLLGVVSTTASLLTAAAPLVLAPALDTAFGSSATPAASFSELSLNNLGATLATRFGPAAAAPGMRLLIVVAALYLACVSLASALGFAAVQLTRWLRTEVANELQATLYRHMLKLSVSFFAQRRAGELSHRFTYDVVSTAAAFDPLIKGVVEASLQILLYGALLLKTDARLALAVAGVGSLHLLITRVLQGEIRRRTTDSFDSYAQMTGVVSEAIAGIRVVKSFSAEEFEQGRLSRLLDDLKRVVLKFGFFQNSEQPLREVANALAAVIALVVSFSALSAGRLSPGGLVLFMMVTRQTILPISQLGTAFVQFQGIVGASQRVREILDATPTIVDGPLEAPPFREALVFKRVSFAHSGGSPVLHEIDLELRRGEVLALVGPSGAGKSTLADLTLRLQDPTHGEITYDGIDLRRFRQASYRSHFGVVSQEALLFNATIEDNIAYGRPKRDEQVRRVAQMANADEFIRATANGYKTWVGDRGVRLSGGQRQRIAIARALYGNPELLILDEATSNLDSESEQQVQEALERAVREMTALVIAHRLATVRRAHRIIVLAEGRIQAIGTHERLIQESALYKRLCELQFADPGAADPE